MSAHRLQELIQPLQADPATTALLFDFDGTLSPTVTDPDDARPAPAAADLLEQLRDRYWRVGAVSGRPLSFLRRVLPSGLVLSGQYGLEVEGPGLAAPPHDLERWRVAVSDAAERAESAGVAGMRVESKGESLTLHWREHPEVEAEVVALAETLSEVMGLVVRPAKKSVELHPSLPTDKGAAVHQLAEGARGVLYVGDDLGDLPAFAALADLRERGVSTVAVAVDNEELPAPVAAAADGTVVGTEGTVALMRSLLG